MRKPHTARTKCSNARGTAPPPPPAAARVRNSGESSAVWLDDEHVTLLEESAEPGRASAREKRYDDTQRIWCPQS
jgi:hypothetical protein